MSKGEWTPLATDFFAHPDVRRAGKDAAMLFLAGLCWAQHHLTDGEIPDETLPLLAVQAWTRPGVADRLTDVGLWERVDDGYQVVGWDEWNRPASEIEARKERERKRKQGWRDAKSRAEPVARRGRDADATRLSRSTQTQTPIDSHLVAFTGEHPQAVDNPALALAEIRSIRKAMP